MFLFRKNSAAKIDILAPRQRFLIIIGLHHQLQERYGGIFPAGLIGLKDVIFPINQILVIIAGIQKGRNVPHNICPVTANLKIQAMLPSASRQVKMVGRD